LQIYRLFKMKEVENSNYKPANVAVVVVVVDEFARS
jgi:hypothetical protein